MKEIKINIPSGITYLSQCWDEIKNQMPSTHMIVDKKVCGCGATEAYLRDKPQKTILASPRKQLLYNKYRQHLGDSHLYRFLSKDQYFSDTKDSASTILQYKDNLKDFINQGGTKILVTYDSAYKVADILVEMGEKLEDWLLLIDEMQAIFSDVFMKPTTELDFTQATKRFTKVVYLSATPYLKEYLESLELFKELPYVELIWPKDSLETMNVEMVKTGSIRNECKKIIKDYRDGNGRTTKVNGQIFESKEAVLYLNSVKLICSIIKENKLTPDEAEIICSGAKKGVLEKIGFKVSTVPEKNAPRKMITLCTSTAYIGCDFYSPSAYSYIFADPKMESMALDVMTDLIQIIGRQRMAENPFRNSATLFYTTKECNITKEELVKRIEEKTRKTERKMVNFRNAPYQDEMIRDFSNTIRLEKYKDDYCAIVKDPKTGKYDVVEHEIVRASEIRGWQIIHDIYNSDFSLYGAIKQNCDVKMTVNTTDPQVSKFFDEWIKDNSFSRKMKLFCSTDKSIIEKTSFIGSKYYKYYDALGEEGLAALSWREDYIKSSIENIPFDPVSKSSIDSKIQSQLKEGDIKSRREVKKMMQDIYDSLNMKRKATSEDLSEYVTLKPKNIASNASKRDKGFEVVSLNRKMVSLFPHLTDPEKSEPWNIDNIMDIIKNNTYYNVKRLVGNVRSAKSDDEMQKRKSRLPLVCWNGVFSHRNSNLDSVKIYSSYVALDFDHFTTDEEMQKTREKLKTYKWIYAIFTTPSGKGMKAIVQHDNIHPEYHSDLCHQLYDMIGLPQGDSHTIDLGRGNFLSYDPMLWLNPSPVSFHYVAGQNALEEHVPQTYTVVKNGKDTSIVPDNQEYSQLLYEFCTNVVSDESILNILRKRWEKDDKTKNRNNLSLSYLGFLCKAGIERDKAVDFVCSLFPDTWTEKKKEISHASKWAYEHNVFGSDRKKYRPHKR